MMITENNSQLKTAISWGKVLLLPAVTYEFVIY